MMKCLIEVLIFLFSLILSLVFSLIFSLSLSLTHTNSFSLSFQEKKTSLSVSPASKYTPLPSNSDSHSDHQGKSLDFTPKTTCLFIFFIYQFYLLFLSLWREFFSPYPSRQFRFEIPINYLVP